MFVTQFRPALLTSWFVVASFVASGGPAAAAKKVKIADDPTMGQPTAPLVLIEFAHYQCGYCVQNARLVLPELRRDYVETGKVQFVFLDRPFSSGGYAEAAAVAAACAHDQGKFWDYQERIWAKFPDWSPADFPVFAEETGLDTALFAQCLAKDGKKRAAIQEDVREAGFAGLSGTPAFVFGRRVEGGGKVEILEAVQGFIELAAFREKLDHWLAQP